MDMSGERPNGEAVAHLFDSEHDEAWRYERFITTIQQRAGISWEKAERAARATLETLAERISPGAARDLLVRGSEITGLLAERLAGGEVDDLIEVLPEELRPALERGKSRKAQRLSLDEFVARVAEREGVSAEEALDHAQAVFTTLREAVPDREFSDVLAELPRGYYEALLSAAS
jgi:uncharacterized protein (DUF2267 family)